MGYTDRGRVEKGKEKSEKIHYCIICERRRQRLRPTGEEPLVRAVNRVHSAVRRDRGGGGGASISKNLPEVKGVRH